MNANLLGVGLKRVTTRALLFSLAPLAFLTHHATQSIGTAAKLEWFDLGDPTLCRTEQPGCGALVGLAHNATLAPLAVCLILIAVAIVSGRREEVASLRWACARSRSSRPARWARWGASAALLVSVVPGIVLAEWPETFLKHSSGWLLPTLALPLLVGTVIGLSVTDDGTGHSGAREDESKILHKSHPLFRGLGHSLTTLRLHLVLVVVYAIAMLVLPQASGQALDALRSWGATGAGTETMAGVATCLLLCFCVRETIESAETIQWAEEAHTSSRKREFDGRGWRLVGFVISAIGFPLWCLGLLSAGVLVLGIIVFALGLMASLPIPVHSGQGTDLGGGSNVARRRRPSWATTKRLWVKVRDARAIERPATAPSISPLGQVLIGTPLLVLSTGLYTVAFDAYWVDTQNSQVAILTILASLTLVLAATVAGLVPKEPVADITVARRRAAPDLPTEHTPTKAAHPLVLPALMLCASTLVMVAAMLANRSWVTLLAVGAAAILTAVLGFVRVLAGYGRSRNWGSLTALVVTIDIMVAIHVDPLATGETLGALSFVNVAASFAVVAGGAALRVARDFEPPQALEWIGATSPPVLTPLLAWWVIAGLSLSPSLHDVPTYDREPTVARTGKVPRTPTIDDAFNEWVAAQPDLASRVDGPDVPMVLVAAHGGGIRAAYWTALVLDCLVAREPGVDPAVDSAARPCHGPPKTVAASQAAARRIFVMSGVSGGAVGIAAYAENLLSDVPFHDGWVEESLGRDFASPTVGWGLFHDLPNHLLGIPASSTGCGSGAGGTCIRQDRARTLEATLDEGLTDPPLLRKTWDERQSPDASTRAKAETVPLLIFNSTLPGGQSAVVTSAAKLGQNRVSLDKTRLSRGSAVSDSLPLGVLETVDLLCKRRDIRISTAAVLSARFPLVSPSGRVTGSCPSMPGLQHTITFTRSCSDDADPCQMNMVDGGYLDNSGLLTLTGLLPEIKRLVANHNAGPGPDIALFVVDVDSAYQAADSSRVNPDNPGETLIPLSTAMTRGAVESYARTRIVRSLDQYCFMSIKPVLHPGLLAPLGWSLSATTQTELGDALDDRSRDGPQNGGQANGRVESLDRIQHWLTWGQELSSEHPLSACAFATFGPGLAMPERR
jgi:hypothetical protein